MSEETVYKAQVGKRDTQISWPAALLIAGGGLLLLANLFRIDLMSFLWPGFIIGPGLLLMWPAHNATAERPSSWAFLAVPGAMLVALGCLFAVMGLINHYEAMAYAWTLVLAAGMGGYMYMNRFKEDSAGHARHHRFIRAMFILFLGLATFFEVLAFQSLGGWWPILLIGFGLYLFVKNHRS
jgi:hypothetical protein